MKETYKKHVYFITSLLFMIYLLAFSILSLLTMINDFANYPLYNFLGSEISLETAILHIVPASNEYYLQEWQSAPTAYFVISMIMLIIVVVFAIKYAKEIVSYSKNLFMFELLCTIILSVYLYSSLYTEIFLFFEALM